MTDEPGHMANYVVCVSLARKIKITGAALFVPYGNHSLVSPGSHAHSSLEEVIKRGHDISSTGENDGPEVTYEVRLLKKADGPTSTDAKDEDL